MNFFPSSDDTFITVNGYKTVSVFINGELRKTRNFEKHIFVVQCVNGEIMLMGSDPNLIIVNENLETKKIFNLADGISLAYSSNNDSISGNTTFIAVGNENYVSCYRRHGVMEPMVRLLNF